MDVKSLKFKNIIFRIADIYNVSKDLSETASGTLNIKGMNESLSVLNGNGHSLIKLNEETNLNIDHMKIENASSVVSGTNENSVVSISNSEIRHNSDGIIFAGKLNVRGNTVISENGSGIKLTSSRSEILLDASEGNIMINDQLSGTAGALLSMKNGDIDLYQ